MRKLLYDRLIPFSVWKKKLSTYPTSFFTFSDMVNRTTHFFIWPKGLCGSISVTFRQFLHSILFHWSARDQIYSLLQYFEVWGLLVTCTLIINSLKWNQIIFVLSSMTISFYELLDQTQRLNYIMFTSETDKVGIWW